MQVVVPLPVDVQNGVGYRTYVARDDVRANGRAASETFGVTHVVGMPDGTVFALQDARVSVGDSDDHLEDQDWGRALVRIGPDGAAAAVDNPFADRDLGRDIAPFCSSPSGDLYAYDFAVNRLVVRDSGGAWLALTAPNPPADQEVRSTGDGGPADAARISNFFDCAATADGAVYVADSCLVRRIDADGTIDTAAGRPEIGRFSGCGTVDSEARSDPPVPPTPYDGPAVDAELSWVTALAAAPDGSVWIAAYAGLVRLGSDGRLESVPVPDELSAPGEIRHLATSADGTLLVVYGRYGPNGIAARDVTTGEWTTLVPLDESPGELAGKAPAPLGQLSLYRADIATSPGRVVLGVAAGINAGMVTLRWD